MKKKANGKRIHKPDRDRFIHEVLSHLKGIPEKEIAAKVQISPKTIKRWRTAETRYPQMVTLAMAARAAGMKFILVRQNEPWEK